MAKRWIVALIVLVILVVVLIIWGPRVAQPPSSVVAPFMVPGVEGTVVSVDLINRSFLMEQTRITEGGNPGFETRSYIVFWNDETIFMDYATPADAAQDLVREAQAAFLAPYKNVIVTQREKAGNVLTALEVRILPGTSRAQVIE